LKGKIMPLIDYKRLKPISILVGIAVSAILLVLDGPEGPKEFVGFGTAIFVVSTGTTEFILYIIRQFRSGGHHDAE
jgi:hypothetical protein